MKTVCHYYEIADEDLNLTALQLFRKLPETEQLTLNSYGIISYFKRLKLGMHYLVVETYDSCD